MQVRILLRLDRRQRLRGIHARFHGAEETKATYTTTTSTGKTTTTTTHTAVEHVSVSDEQHLFGTIGKSIAGNRKCPKHVDDNGQPGGFPGKWSTR